MTSAAIELRLSELVIALSAFSGAFIGVTVRNLIPSLEQKGAGMRGLNIDFLQSLVYAIVPCIVTLLINHFFLFKVDSSGGTNMTPVIAVFLGLVGEPLTIWFTKLQNLVIVGRAVFFGAKEFKNRLEEFKDLNEDEKDDDNNGG